MSWSRRVVSALAAVLVGTVAGAVPAPAQAASGYCPKGSGATVVVDRGALGGGTSVGCDANGANTPGSTVVPRAGYSLTYVQQQPGFVCRVGGAPASASCANTPPSNAYWGLFWSDGKSGRWTYASTGVGSLKVPAGGFIGWKWQNSSSRTTPGRAPVSPVAASPKPKPKPKPAPKPAPKSAPQAGPRHSPGTRTAPSSGQSSGQSSGPSSRHSTATSPGQASAGATKHSARAGSTAAARHSARHQTAQQHKAAHAKKAAAAKRARASASASASQSAAVAGQDGSSSASPSPELTSGDAAPSSGSGPMLPLFATGILVLLLGAAGRLVWVRRRG